MINTDYKIEGIEYLLDKSCILERYYPLIDFKDKILLKLKAFGCERKSDAYNLSNEKLADIGFDDVGYINLFKRFLCLYDINKNKMKELEKLKLLDGEKNAFHELYLLPGVKQTRAKLYYLSGYKTLLDVANSSKEEIIERTKNTVSKFGLLCSIPLPKEARTHVAVAKAFTL